MEYGVTVYSNPTPILTNRSDDHLWRGVNLGTGMDTRATSGAHVNAKSAMGYPPLWRAINLISSSVAGLPLDCFRRDRKGGKKVDLRHPAQQLLDRKASPYMSAFMFRRTMTGLALLHGNAYASIDRQDGRPVAFSIWNPQNTLVRVVDGEIWYATYFGATPVKVPGRDMLHIRGLGPDGVVGYPILSLMAEALGLGLAAMEFGSKFFGNGSSMSGLLMIPGHFSEEKIRNTISAWNSMQAGLTNAHKVALIQDGVKFQQLTVNPEQAQFLQTREHEVRATVANITGVPPHMLGDSTRTSHNSLESEGQSYLDYTLQPWLKTWETECEDKLLTQQQQEQDTHFIEFNREALIQMTFKDKVEGIYKQTEMGLLDTNEGRRLLNYPELPESQNKRYHPANWVVVGQEQAVPSAQQPAQQPQPNQAQNLLQKMVTSSVTRALEIEGSRIIRLAGTSPNFINSMDEFYQTWTENSLPDLEAARTPISKHAEESKRELLAIAGTSTTHNLRENVCEVVATWQDRSESLITEIMKAVQ